MDDCSGFLRLMRPSAPCVVVIDVTDDEPCEQPHIEFRESGILRTIVYQRIKLRHEPLLCEWREIKLVHDSVYFWRLFHKITEISSFRQKNQQEICINQLFFVPLRQN